MTDANNGPYIHPLIIEWFSKSWPAGEETIRCWTEYYQPNGDMLRAHPNFRRNGPKYDYASVRFADDDNIETDYPSKLLCFFQTSTGTFALVLPCDLQSKQGTLQQRLQHRHKTKILERHALEVTQVTRNYDYHHNNQRIKGRDIKYIPNVFKVPMHSIIKRLMVVQETHGEKESYENRNQYVWVVADRKSTWANKFLPSQH